MLNHETSSYDDLTPAERVYADYREWFSQTPACCIRDPFLREMLWSLWDVVKNEVESGN